MSVSIAGIRRNLRDREFGQLFVEGLGWDRVPASPIVLSVNGTDHRLRPIAQKRGAVFCLSEGIPDRITRARIERALAKIHFEHVVAFVDAITGDQVWQWAKRDPNRPVALREHWLRNGQSGQALAERLAGLTVNLDEEAELTLTGVTARMRRTFDADRVTKAFYDRFKDEHGVFLAFISGIQELADREWYASLMLNRLMFTYFIQKKGFLDRDGDYLRNRLQIMQRKIGQGHFLTFYRHFLLRLFHEGFGRQRLAPNPELDELLGSVPYLNGGLFEVHELERKYPELSVPDEAFSRVFDFFDGYTWHLDARPLRNDREINPDVLGYIFEKYINQKEMGAYYTKEDITNYIAASTVVPAILEGARDKCTIAFRRDGPVWGLLRDNPDRYLPDALSYGLDRPLPAQINAGIENTKARHHWNQAAASEVGLPTETWREQIERRGHATELRQRLVAGDIASIDDLLATNLDICQFVQDSIDNAEGPELLRAFYQALTELSVLDPACGSGAFLFAALTMLEPFYEACLARMQSFIDEPGSVPVEAFADFQAIIAHVGHHPNLRYFILKSIIVGNLYGVDIMEEAVEICKLRLFLKLVAQVDQQAELEPLPDVDFNIRAGNTLVGYATRKALDKAVGEALDFEGAGNRIADRAAEVDRAFHDFQAMQLADTVDGAALAIAKKGLRNRLADLRSELDRYLASQYGVVASGSSFVKWTASHVPFHWIVEFYGIMRTGGFDVVIGNPPYVEYSKVKAKYTVHDFETLACGNIYAFMLERSLQLVNRRGVVGLIVPLSLVCTQRMAPLRSLLDALYCRVTSYDMRPSSLFEGVAQRLCIVLTGPQALDQRLLVGGYRRWSAEERPALIPTTRYTRIDPPPAGTPIPKYALPIETEIRSKLGGGSVEVLLDTTVEAIYVHRIVRYFIKALDFVPVFIGASGQRGRSEDYKPFQFRKDATHFMVALLNSSLFYWFWRTHSDGFHCGYGDVFQFPHEYVMRGSHDAFSPLASRLMGALRRSSAEKTISTRTGVIRYQEFYPKSTKPILDEIDAALGRHYGFSPEELDFLVNYDIKYRLKTDEESDALLAVTE